MANENNNNRPFYGDIFCGFDYGTFTAQDGTVRNYQNIYIGAAIRPRKDDNERICGGVREVRKFPLKNRNVIDESIPLGAQIEIMKDNFDKVSLVSVISYQSIFDK